MRKGFSIRTKLLLVALLLLMIPWMSYVYVRDMKAFLLSGQEEALGLTSRAVATVLHDRPELFLNDKSSQSEQSEDNEVYVYPLSNYINLNGELSDWQEQVEQAETYLPVDNSTGNNSFKVKHLLGHHGRFIYAFFDISDDRVLFRQPQFLRLDAADHLRLTLLNPGREPQRYTLSAREDGRMSIYLMDAKWQYPVTGKPDYNLAANLRRSEQGYIVEMRIPRFMLSSDTRINLAVVDIDSAQNLQPGSIIETTPKSEGGDLARLLVQSQEIAKILQGLDRPDTRIWVINHAKQVRTVVGDIITENQSEQLEKPLYNKGKKLDFAIDNIRYYYEQILQATFNLIVDKPLTDKSVDNHEVRNDQVITQALKGNISTDRRPSVDNKSVIIMSGHPIYLGDEVLGAVIVEQSTNQVLQKQRDVLENVISVTLLVLITVAAALLTFASRLTYRIRRLRNATDNAIDSDGRITNQRIKADRNAGDEIGDLSRSVSNMLGRLSQYTSYLRGLPDTLAHEVSNPLNVVNSSLHNLTQENPSVSDSKYMERAKNGINRIGAILRNLTEAANLEQAMQSETKEAVDLIELIENYRDGYAFSNPEQKFEFIIRSSPLIIQAAPDYIAQALDKLVDNALDFAAPDTPIVFRAQRMESIVQIDVINLGSKLPEGMAERIFEPLVSLGRKDAQKTRLGMGLYIVKLIASFHGGDVIARNLTSSDGVIFSLSLPLHEDYTPAI